MTEIEWLDTFGDNLQDMLDDARMSRRELADETGISVSTICRYINKQTVPNIFAIINIAYALNCSVDDLIDFGRAIK